VPGHEWAIEEILALAQVEVRTKRGRAAHRFGNSTPAGVGDRVQLQQVVLNLIRNGIEANEFRSGSATRAGDPNARSQDDQVIVIVQDSGTGLDPRLRSRCSTPFNTTKAKAMGMGLSISRSMVKDHGGRRWATTNEGPGQLSVTLSKHH